MLSMIASGEQKFLMYISYKASDGVDPLVIPLVSWEPQQEALTRAIHKTKLALKDPWEWASVSSFRIVRTIKVVFDGRHELANVAEIVVQPPAYIGEVEIVENKGIAKKVVKTALGETFPLAPGNLVYNLQGRLIHREPPTP